MLKLSFVNFKKGLSKPITLRFYYFRTWRSSVACQKCACIAIKVLAGFWGTKIIPSLIFEITKFMCDIKIDIFIVNFYNIKNLQNTLIALWKCFNNSILDVLPSALAYVFFFEFACLPRVSNFGDQRTMKLSRWTFFLTEHGNAIWIQEQNKWMAGAESKQTVIRERTTRKRPYH